MTIINGALLATSAIASVMHPAAATARPEAQVRFSVPAQPVHSAIGQLGRQAGIQIVAVRKVTGDRLGNAVQGTMSVQDALDRLLRGTGLVARRTDGRTYSVIPGAPATSLSQTTPPSPPQSTSAPTASPTGAGTGDAGTAAGGQTRDAGAAVAQDASGAAAAAPPGTDVVVTGSRLQNRGFNAPTPVTVLGTATIQQRSPANIADVVNETPAFRVSRSDTVRTGTEIQAGVQNTLDLRGLGDQRTLTLINGRRVVATNVRGSVDTNIIPVGLVERIEVVTGGASAAYGSDAVAGVVNFILRDKLTGLTGSLQTGITDRGDGAQYTATLAGGTGFAQDRGHLVFGADYNKSNGIGNPYTRAWGRNEIGIVTPTAAQRAAGGLPASIVTNGVEPGNAAPAGLYAPSTTTAYTFDQLGNPVPFSRGTVYGTSMVGSTSNYGHNVNNINPLRSGTSRIVAYGRASFDVTPALTAYAEANFAHTRTEPFETAEYISGANLPALNILTTNPYVTPATLALLPAGATSLSLGRINTEFGGNVVEQNSDVERFVAGVGGRLFGSFKWDAYYQRGRTIERFYDSGVVAAALQKAVNGCGTTSNLSAAQLATLATYESVTGKTCVGFNPFGINRSPAALNYFMNEQTHVDRIAQDVIAGSISGSPLTLWAGDVSVAAGLEYRRDRLRSQGDYLAGLGTIYTQGNFTTYGGVQKVKEGFLEVGVPLARNLSFAKALDLNAAVRRTDYSLSGAVTTWKVGGTWQPFSALRLRFTRSRDIRAPSLQELFLLGGFIGVTGINDIPNGVTGANGTVNVNPLGTANTVAQPLNQAGLGNPGLVPEKADTYTGGGVLQFGQLRLSVDYYHVRVNGAVVRLTTQQTIDQCRDGVAAQCANIVFDPTVTGGIASVTNRNTNLQTLTVSGVDFEAAYRMPMPFAVPGSLAIRALANYAPQNSIYSPLTKITTEQAGILTAQPRWSGDVTVGYESPAFDFDVQFRGFTSLRGNSVLTGTATTILGPEDAGYSPSSNYSVSKNRYPGRVYVNPSIIIRANRQFSFFLNVDNLFDVDPPALTYTGLPYDFIGRKYRAGVRIGL